MISEIFAGTLIIGAIVGFFALIGFIGAWLWNITLPYLFGLPTVEWWHILALCFLLWILIPTSSVRRSED